jgi:hypothetical protein
MNRSIWALIVSLVETRDLISESEEVQRMKPVRLRGERSGSKFLMALVLRIHSLT